MHSRGQKQTLIRNTFPDEDPNQILLFFSKLNLFHRILCKPSPTLFFGKKFMQFKNHVHQDYKRKHLNCLNCQRQITSLGGALKSYFKII